MGVATLALGIWVGAVPNAVQPCCAGQVVGDFPLFVHRPRSQAITNSQKKKLKRAGHEPVCVVPESLGNHCPICPICMCLAL